MSFISPVLLPGRLNELSSRCICVVSYVVSYMLSETATRYNADHGFRMITLMVKIDDTSDNETTRLDRVIVHSGTQEPPAKYLAIYSNELLPENHADALIIVDGAFLMVATPADAGG